MSKGKTALEERMHTSQQRYALPAGAREVILVRHGSTGGEVVHTLELGDLVISDPDLLPIGHVQAAAVAARLRVEPVSRIFVTPLRRTRQTAAPLVDLTGIEPEVVADLREAYLGEWEHQFHIRVAARDPLLARMFEEEDFGIIPGAETMAAFADRVRRGIDAILDGLRPNEAAIAFVHGGTIGEICRQATGSRTFAFFSPENTSITRLVVPADGRWSLRSYNDVAHLVGID